MHPQQRLLCEFFRNSKVSTRSPVGVRLASANLIALFALVICLSSPRTVRKSGSAAPAT